MINMRSHEPESPPPTHPDRTTKRAPRCMATFLRIPNLYFETLLDVSQKTTCPKPLRLKHLSISQKCKTSATHYGNASRKRKTSATHYGNVFLVCMFQIGVSKRVLPKRSKPCILNAFGRFSESHWSTPEVDMKKWISGSGRQRALMAIVQSVHFFNIICKFCSSESICWPPF